MALVETYAKAAGLWADALATAEYERTLRFDLSTVVRNMAGPSNPHKRLPTSALAERGIAAPWQMPAASEGTMPDGAVVIAAITSCTNTSNPRNVIAAGLLARNANARGLAPQAVGEDLAGTGIEGGAALPEEAKLLPDLEALALASSPSPAPPATA